MADKTETWRLECDHCGQLQLSIPAGRGDNETIAKQHERMRPGHGVWSVYREA